MNPCFSQEGGKLVRRFENEILQVEPWGNGLRVRAVQNGYELEANDWALLKKTAPEPKIEIGEDTAKITNGSITAAVLPGGRLVFTDRGGAVLLEEDRVREERGALRLNPRGFRPISGGDYGLTVRFESDPKEKIFGMGQYQQPFLDLKGCRLELAHRNTQASVPFLISSLGYGFLWNNPAVGSVFFGKNGTEWNAEATKEMDYWITAEDTPAGIEEDYAAVTGTVPMMPEYGMGFWQCKLRYQTQDEVLQVAREYKRRGLPLDVIVVDFFHWEHEGDWKFDPKYWPDPKKMVAELKSMGVELMVSVWPTVDRKSENYGEMRDRGLLVRTERGVQTQMEFVSSTVFYDATNPEARRFIWETVKKNYYDSGVRIFWLDEAEPEYGSYDYENYRYFLGTDLQVGNIYPELHAKAFYDGMREAGQEGVVNLLRCAWAGSQRYGALVWSGDIRSDFESLRNQVRCGLNMAIAGIPWWTTDIGGFYGGNPNDEKFRECIVRWFEWGAFCPVFRLHGDREPHDRKPLGTAGGGMFASGWDNEVWSYGEEAYGIFRKYMLLREKLRPYIRKAMKEAHEKGTPPMRPLFYDFSKDETAWEIDDEYLFGSDLLVAPVLYEGAGSRGVYLPEGARWLEYGTGKVYEGGRTVTADAPLDVIPLFLKDLHEIGL